MDRPLELNDFEYIGDDWHFDAPIRGYILPTSKGGQGPDKILVIDDLFDMIRASRKNFLYGGRVGYQEGNTVKKEFKDFTEDEKEEFLKKYEEWLKDQNKKMEAAANRQREAMAFDGFLNFMERNKRGIPPVDERTGLYGFANPDVLDVNLKKQIADDIYLQGGAQFLPNGDPYYSAGITKTFNKGGRVGFFNGGLMSLI